MAEVAAMTEMDVRAAFEGQARACLALGSPFTARLCTLFAQRLAAGHPVADRLLGWVGDPTPKADSVPLRIAGCLHALVLEQRSAELAKAYPPHAVGDEVLWRAVDRVLRDHADFLLARLQSAPQTNEVRRSGALLPGFLEISRLFGLPLVLSELGASAGLNLQWDRYRYRLGETAWGDLQSPVTIAPEWRGGPAPEGTINVSSRAGCDLNPIDAGNADDRLRLLSYIWADQDDRLERTLAALAIADDHRLKVEKADAVAWLKSRLSALFPGASHVIYHSIAWQYLPKGLQDEGEHLIATAGLRATREAPLARLSLEAEATTTALRSACKPGRAARSGKLAAPIFMDAGSSGQGGATPEAEMSWTMVKSNDCLRLNSRSPHEAIIRKPHNAIARLMSIPDAGLEF